MDFKNPNYIEILERRLKHLDFVRNDPKKLQGIKTHYASYPADFINDWGMTFDPRRLEQGLTANIPFVLWPKQREYIDWLYERWQAGERGLVEKSRDCGVTWLSVGFAVALWCFHDGVAIGFGSRKESLVDKLGDPDSIFEKLRHFINQVPKIFLPDEYSSDKNSAFMRIVSPNTGASITGEAGDNIGRGGRKSIMFVDEAAFIEHQETVDKALSQTTNCQIDISTFNGSGNPFYQKWQRFRGTDRHFVFDWAQPLDAKILTPSGWSTMGDMAVGDKVIGSNGKPAKVIGVYPKGVKPVYKVSFNDGASTECCDEHLWSVIPYGNQRAERKHIRKTLTLSTIRRDYISLDSRGFKKHNYQIPITEPVKFKPVKLPLDPYILGCLLGDGSLPENDQRPIELITADHEMSELVSSRLPDDCYIRHDGGIKYRLSAGKTYRGGGKGRGLHSPINKAIKELGLSGAKSHNKFIPEIYKLSSISDRVDLIQGLLDTDGSVAESNHGTGRLSTTSKQLADDAVFIVETLGGTGVIYDRPAGRRKFPANKSNPDGRWSDCRAGFTVNLNFPEWMSPFKLTRKTEAYSPAKKYGVRRSIVNIELVGEKESQCIKVDAEDSLYLTDHCILTHNTDDPRKDEAWYERQKAEQTEETVAQEIDRDPLASNIDSFIPAKWVRASLDAHIKLAFNPEGIRTTGFDPADTGDAKAVAIRHGSVVTNAVEMKRGDITTALPWAFELAERCQVFAFDADGMGAPTIKAYLMNASAGELQVAEYRGSGAVDGKAKRFGGSDGISRTNGDTFTNYKAQTWTWLRRRFELTYNAIEKQSKGVLVNADPDELISISSECVDVNQLLAELSQPRRIWKNGKIAVENKPDMKSRGVQSPNLAEAVVMAMSVQRVKPDIRTALLARYVPHRISDPGVGY